MNRLALLLLLVPLWAGAAPATYYVDLSGTGSGDTSGSTVGNQCAGAGDASCTPSAGDTLYLCNAGSTQLAPGVAGSAGNVITYDGSCPGGTAGSITTTAASASFSIASTRPYITVKNLLLANTGSASCAASNAANLTWQNNTIGPCGASGIILSATADIDNLTITGNAISGTGSNCVGAAAITGANTITGIVISNNTLTDCGDGSEEHGIRITVNSGIAAVISGVSITGNTITRPAQNGVQLQDNDSLDCAGTCSILDPYVADNTIRYAGTVDDQGGGILIKGGRCTSAPCVMVEDNDIQYSGGGVGGIMITYTQDGIVQDNTAANGTFALAPADNGGIDLDHLATRIIVRRNLVYGNVGNAGVVNSGYGIAILDAVDCQVYSNIGFGNLNGLFIGPAGGTPSGNVAYNNTFSGNTSNGVFIRDSMPNTTTLYNNAFVYNGEYGVYRETGTSVDQTMDYNAVYGNTDGGYSAQAAGANDITSAPGFVGGTSPDSPDGFRLRCGSPLIRAGTDVGRFQDYGNRAFAIGTPSIGAWEMASGDERCTVTSRSTITTRSTITPRTTINAR